MRRFESVQRLAKRALDVAGAAGGLAALSPVLVGTAFAVRTTMGAPVLFVQERPGHNGQPFHLMKFRTMRHAAPGEGPETDGARITRLGRFLRASSLDELPTLLNVLRGDMSLVGPRPLLMQYLDRYSPEQARRHDARPGITGWAQINGRNAISWEEKFRLDVWYVDHWSIALDMRILLSTVGKVLQRDGISATGHTTMPVFTGSPAE
jgi:sugar transferase EpsL